MEEQHTEGSWSSTSCGEGKYSNGLATLVTEPPCVNYTTSQNLPICNPPLDIAFLILKFIVQRQMLSKFSFLSLKVKVWPYFERFSVNRLNFHPLEASTYKQSQLNIAQKVGRQVCRYAGRQVTDDMFFSFSLILVWLDIQSWSLNLFSPNYLLLFTPVQWQTPEKTY